MHLMQKASQTCRVLIKDQPLAQDQDFSQERTVCLPDVQDVVPADGAASTCQSVDDL
jgi:hypothetical protein